jgi:predicted RNA methylase
MKSDTQNHANEFAIPTRKINSDVLQVLNQCRVEDNKVYLPKIQLDRKLYTDVNDVLVVMGGRWKSGKTAAHVFADLEPEELTGVFDNIRQTGEYINPKDLGFFPTPKELVAQLIEKSGIQPGMTVLEPSAGNGAIAAQAAAVVGMGNVMCIEVFKPNVTKLQEKGFQVIQHDFLAIQAGTKQEHLFDAVIMNPPFAKMQDIAHVQHACKFLKENGKLVAITSPSWLTTSNKKSEAFRALVADSLGVVEKVAAGSFKESGTMVATSIIVIEAENLPWNRREAENEAEIASEAIAPCA